MKTIEVRTERGILTHTVGDLQSIECSPSWAQDIMVAQAERISELESEMPTYRVSIREELSGVIEVEASSQEEAEAKARELMDTHGVEMLFYPPKETQYTHDDDLTKYNGDHVHREAEILGCAEVNK